MGKQVTQGKKGEEEEEDKWKERTKEEEGWMDDLIKCTYEFNAKPKINLYNTASLVTQRLGNHPDLVNASQAFGPKQNLQGT